MNKRSAHGSICAHDRLLRLDIQSGCHTRLELLKGDGCVGLGAHISAKILQDGIEGLDHAIDGDADQVLILARGITQLVRQTSKSLVKDLRVELVQRRPLVAEDGSESVAQILTALLKLMDVIELKGDVWLQICHEVLTYQIDARLLDHKIGLTEKKLEE